MIAAELPASYTDSSEIKSRSMKQRLFPRNAEFAIQSMAVIWLGYLVFAALFIYLLQPPFPLIVLSQYGLLAMVSVFGNWLLYRLLLLAGGGQTAPSLVLLTIPTMILAVLVSYLGFSIIDHDSSFVRFSSFIGEKPAVPQFWPELMIASFIHYLIFACWSGIYLAFAHHRTTIKAMENSRQLERETRDSELRALRYQLNPHFIFNALNSVSSLIIDDKNSDAEELVDGLADYMRMVLNDDGGSMVRVEDEIAQQVRYLEIEQVRFPDRLHFSVAIDPAVREWRIPTLIIQPLIENAIKHGVARSIEPVSIAISATMDAGRLKLTVVNNGRMVTESGSEHQYGTGLRNVRARLQAVYGHSAALIVGNRGNDMTIASIIVPEERMTLLGL